MISLHPSLLIKRLVVYSKSSVAYDQIFHTGVNIIRGDNAHGKSTIADFIFYVLGGDNNLWKEHALECDTVTAEIEINGVDFVVRRYVSEQSRQPLQVFWGSFDQSSQNAVSGWEMYPYARSVNKESFSQKLFYLMDLPQIRGMEGDAITMHQLMRLIYVDQISPYDSLLRTEAFDSSLKREAISDLMLGLYDRSVHDDQLELQEKQRELESARAEIKILQHVLAELGIKIDAEEIQKERMQTEAILARINSEITAISSFSISVEPWKAEEDASSIRLIELRKQHSAEFEKLQSIKFEIEDSKLFLRDVDTKIEAIQDSISARRGLGEISLEFCPVCLSPITQEHEDQSTCRLCRGDIDNEALNASAMRMLSELEMQKQESTELLDRKISEGKRTTRELRNLEDLIEITQKDKDRMLESMRSSRDQKLDSLFQDRGATSEKLKSLHQGIRSVQILREFENKAKDIQQIIDRLKFSIQENKKKYASKFNTVNNLISEIALTILKEDHVEDKFTSAQKVELDWRKNTFWIDGRNNFSASSVVFARNAVHFALFFASLKLDFMRYPRFILCDCMEDKGMIPARSANFQRAIVKMSQATNVRHQIIFTTSMIDESLETENFCIGPAYLNGLRTLNLPENHRSSYFQSTIL